MRKAKNCGNINLRKYKLRKYKSAEIKNCGNLRPIKKFRLTRQNPLFFLNISIERRYASKFGDHRILVSGKIYDKYDENIVKDYMTGNSVEIIVDISTGRKNFTTYTMDLTHKYIEINADYRS